MASLLFMEELQHQYVSQVYDVRICLQQFVLDIQKDLIVIILFPVTGHAHIYCAGQLIIISDNFFVLLADDGIGVGHEHLIRECTELFFAKVKLVDLNDIEEAVNARAISLGDLLVLFVFGVLKEVGDFALHGCGEAFVPVGWASRLI